MKRVALIGTLALVYLIVVWIAYEVTGIEVETGPLLMLFVLVFAMCLAMDFLHRRIADARIASGVMAVGVTIMVWAGAQLAGLAVEHGMHIVLFAATFLAHFLWLRRRVR